MRVMLFSIFLGLCYLVVGMYYSITYNIPVLGAFVLMTSPFLMVFLSIKLDDLVDYAGVVKRRFKLDIKTETYHETVYKLGSGQLEGELLTTTHYKYIIRSRIFLTMTSDVANKYFLDPMKPTINELTMFELCGYNNCIQTFGEPYDYSKSFDELFGYYMQEGFINKFKYIIKNRGRLKTGRIR